MLDFEQRGGCPGSARRVIVAGHEMGLTLDGYRVIRELRRSETRAVHAAVRERDQRAVVAKVYSLGGRPELEVRVQHEFELIRSLELPGVVRALDIERSGTGLVLILDMFEGVSLADHCAGRSVRLGEFLDLATRLATILASVHERRVIHRDIKPQNVLINPETNEIALADFGISVLLEGERRRIHDPGVLTGTLPYIAPEQTGRTGREVDFRSDLYSLGVTFYELLAGRRPFAEGSALELIHAHLARPPTPLASSRPDLPGTICALVMKLLEKAPERRYQSARSLARDLERMRDRYAGGRSLSRFEFGPDVSSVLQLPHRLYGRERERERLSAALRETVRAAPRMVILRGPAGVGKSALIDELLEPLLARRGLMARGKFDPNSGAPLSAILDALAAVSDQLLTEPDESLARWRVGLGEALGALAGPVVELVPKLAAILEPEPVESDAPSSPVEARNRVMVGISRLLQALAGPRHPLILALDDLQWADPASCELLAELLAVPSVGLLVVGTSRDDPLDEGHGLSLLLDTLREREREPERIELGPLSTDALNELIADSLSLRPDAARPLTEIVSRKTDNNPFFVRQFLVSLDEVGLLRSELDGWTWDAAAIESATLPEGSLEIMSAKLDRLGPETVAILEAASVFGAQFDAAATLAIAREHAGCDAIDHVHIHQLVDEGLIAAHEGGYVFGHDRIREAAYDRLDEDERRALHLAAGRRLLATLDEAEVERRVIEIVVHLDRGHRLIGGPDPSTSMLSSQVSVDELVVSRPHFHASEAERAKLASLNIRAGLRALASGAPKSALPYLEIGVGISQPDHPQRFAAVHGLASARILGGAPERGDTLLAGLLHFGPALGTVPDPRLLGRELTPDEFGRLIQLRCLLLTLRGDREGAVRFGFDGLRVLGVAMPRKLGPVAVVRAFVGLLWALRGSPLDRIGTRPSTDPRAHAAMDLAAGLTRIAYMTSIEAFLLLAERHIDLVQHNGDHWTALTATNGAGLIVNLALNRPDRALALTERCLARADGPVRYQRNTLLGTMHMFGGRKTPYRELAMVARDNAMRMLELGDLSGASLESLGSCIHSLVGGVNLHVTIERCDAHLRRVEQWGTTAVAGGAEALLAAARIYAHGPVPRPGEREPFAIPRGGEGMGELLTYQAQIISAQLLCVFGRWQTCLEILDEIRTEAERKLRGTWYVDALGLFTGLALGAALEHAEGRARRRLRRRLHRQLARIRHECERGAAFEHAAGLLEAELAFADGDFDRASRALVRAREAAAARGNPIYEALAYERMAELARRRGLDDYAREPLRKARERYLHWGALAKVGALDASWNGGLDDELGVSSVSGTLSRTLSLSTSSSDSGTSDAVDMMSILKASQAITRNIRLDEVLTRTMTIAVENAGAERGALLLATGKGLSLVAECDVDGGAVAFGGAPRALATLTERLPTSLLQWVGRTKEAVILADARTDLHTANDAYVQATDGRALSVLCMPISKQERLVAVLYLENRLISGSFGPDRLEILEHVMAQAAGALENAQLYEALHASEVRWRLLIERLPGIVALLDRDGRIEFINLVDGRGPLRGRSFAELVHAADRETLGHHLDLAFAGTRGGADEFEVQTELDGAPHWSIRLAPIHGDAGVERVILVASDISSRRRAERERAELEAQLRGQQRLEALGTLASGVAHEINNPIQGIMNYTELILDEEHVGPGVRDLVAEIRHESDRMAAIVRNLLTFARQDRAVAFEPTRIADIVDRSLSLIRTILQRDSVRLVVELPDDLPAVACNSQQIQQVVMNLVTNARDALNARFPKFHEDKQITIAARAVVGDAGRRIELSVGDRAGGVPEELVEQIFDPFFTTKEREQGTGLGLAISHGIVREHGGELTLDNHPGEGARFVVSLPAIE